MNLEKLIKLAKTNWYVVLFVLIAGGYTAFDLALDAKGSNAGFAKEGSHLVIVKPGMTTRDIADFLHKNTLVKDTSAFLMEAKMSGLEKKLQAGPYQIKGGMSNREIITTLAKGSIKTLRFTIPEGYNVMKTAHKLEAEGLGTAEKFLAASKDYAPFEYMQTDNANIPFKAEGFLYPATYDIPYGMSEDRILATFVKAFDESLVEEGFKKEIADRNLRVRDVVNMAAMVELEAVFAEEQPRIAGVFQKRLDIGMPIQSDTTIQYILGAQKEIITFSDTKIDDPYNTYQNPGLPPGPIASPSMHAIKAVLHPEQTDYLYFVAEKDGHHRFTKSYAEHLRAIDEIG